MAKINQDFQPNRSARPHSDEPTRFSRPTLEQYAETILAEAGLRGLAEINIIFRRDAGTPVNVVLRTTGGGYDYCGEGGVVTRPVSTGWLLFEKLPGPSADYLRARLFDTLAGGCAEFATKLVVQMAGDVTIREPEKAPNSSHRGRNIYIAFEGVGRVGMCSMLLAPAETALDTATRMFCR